MQNISKPSISIAIFTCDDFSDLWETNVFFLKKNFPIKSFEKIILVTDKPTIKKIDGIEIIWPTDFPDHLNKLKCLIDKCQTKYFLFTLDDYFFIKQISQEFINSCIKFMTDTDANYLKLNIRHYSKTKTPQISYNMKFYTLRTELPYALDLYPSIWNTKFASETVDKWIFPERTIWHYEGKLYKLNQFMSLNKCYCVKSKNFCFEDVIRKGGLLNHAHSVLYNKFSIDLTKTRRLRTKREDFKNKIDCFISAWTPLFIKSIIKNRLRKKGKKFYSD